MAWECTKINNISTTEPGGVPPGSVNLREDSMTKVEVLRNELHSTIEFYLFSIKSSQLDAIIKLKFTEGGRYMSNNKQKDRKANNSNKSRRNIAIVAGVAVALIAVFIVKGSLGGGSKTASSGEDLVISKSEVSQTAKFYPYSVGGTKMEVVALKASDGTIRTAFNTCQVCFDSGKGYYKQEGDVLVCQNCGNRFKADQVEKIKGGCNPVPIMEENKTDDGTNITISKDFLAQNKDLFSNWKT